MKLLLRTLIVAEIDEKEEEEVEKKEGTLVHAVNGLK